MEYTRLTVCFIQEYCWLQIADRDDEIHVILRTVCLLSHCMKAFSSQFCGMEGVGGRGRKSIERSLLLSPLVLK